LVLASAVAVLSSFEEYRRPLPSSCQSRFVRAKITWSEQDVGGGKLVVEVTVKNMTRPKTDDQLRSDARALAVRFARAFADTIEN
jgi:hypothetical protein